MLRKFIHGEVVVYETKQLPNTVKKINVNSSENFFIVGESETHGNDHRVAVLDKNKVEFFEDENGKLYMRNLVETEIYCPNKYRHDTEPVPPSIWEITKSREYDYIEQQARQVRD